MYTDHVILQVGFHVVVGHVTGARGTDLWKLILYIIEQREALGGVN